MTDGSGNPVDGAQVQVSLRKTGSSRGSMTNSDGRFTVAGLESGSGYVVTVRRIGFQPEAREGVTVALGQTTRQNFELKQFGKELEKLVKSPRS